MWEEVVLEEVLSVTEVVTVFLRRGMVCRVHTIFLGSLVRREEEVVVGITGVRGHKSAM